VNHDRVRGGGTCAARFVRQDGEAVTPATIGSGIHGAPSGPMVARGRLSGDAPAR